LRGAAAGRPGLHQRRHLRRVPGPRLLSPLLPVSAMTATRGGFDSESALAAVVVAWLEHEGWDVFQEVESPAGLCDIVAVRGPLVWSVETKLAFGTGVVEQAYDRLRFAHLVSVATPQRRGSSVLEHYCRWQGIGWLQVDDAVALDRRPLEACLSEV